MDTLKNRPSAARLLKQLASREAVLHLEKSNINVTALRTHIQSVEAFKDAKIISHAPNLDLSRFRDFPGVPLARGRQLDVNAFADAMHRDLSVRPISGYTLRVRQAGVTVYTLFWNWARRPQDDNERGWKPDLKMHVASVSKLVTMMGLVKLLHEKNISVDTPVSAFLPTYFRRGANVQGLTFRHLLTHTSGLRDVKAGGINDGYTFADFKAFYEQGVQAANIGHWHYHNGNFIALRIAMSVLMGRVRADFTMPHLPFLPSNLTDAVWDNISIDAYTSYTQQNIFLPSFVQASFEPTRDTSLAYPPDLSAHGVVSNAKIHAGTAGWWLSVDEIMNVMNTFWQSDAIVPKAVARQALRDGFAIDEQQRPANRDPDCFLKSGYWSHGGGQTEQCVIAFAPNDIEIAVFVNSPIPDTNIHNITSNLLRQHIH
jgi:CubicO group peptidase (beta-lactamase class C family)